MGRTILLRVVVGALVASWVAGCATDRLDAAPPSGVNLTGDWALNLNLSDDPDKMGPDPDTTLPAKSPGSHRGHGGGRGGGGRRHAAHRRRPPDGGPTASYEKAGYGFVRVADTPPCQTEPGRQHQSLSTCTVVHVDHSGQGIADGHDQHAGRHEDIRRVHGRGKEDRFRSDRTTPPSARPAGAGRCLW